MPTWGGRTSPPPIGIAGYETALTEVGRMEQIRGNARAVPAEPSEAPRAKMNIIVVCCRMIMMGSPFDAAEMPLDLLYGLRRILVGELCKRVVGVGVFAAAKARPTGL